MRCWHSYLSGMRCKWFAYSPADATTIPSSSQKSGHYVGVCLSFSAKLTGIWRYFKHNRESTFHIFSMVQTCFTISVIFRQSRFELEMWANAQRDSRPAKYRWRSLFNPAKFGWRPLLEYRAVTLPRCETCWNLQGCPKLTKRSQPLVGWSSPYYGVRV